MVDPALRARVLGAPIRLHWTLRDSAPDRIAAHAYLVVEDGSPRLLHLIHAPDTTPWMVPLMDEWNALHPGRGDRREWTSWYPPDSQWSFTVDAGALADALRDRDLVHEELAGPDVSAALTDFPESFLRDPVGTLVRALAGDVGWPAHLDASVLRPRFHHAASGGLVVVTGCRYGSRHADAGQDRTAAVFVSRERGQWSELPWDLPLRQRLSPSGRFSWPPEQIDRVEIVGDGPGVPRIEFEDPWILFEPGTEWRATWMPRDHHWRMEERT
jgi:hypothetical protein